MEIIAAVSGNKPFVSNAEFVKLTIYNDVANVADTSIYTFSSSYKDETIDGQVYAALGGLLAVGVQQRDLRVTSADTSVTLSGIGADNIYLVLAKKIKGARIEITRGFYDTNSILTSTAKRFTGICTSYAIAEERVDQTDNFTVTVNASSYKYVLQNRQSGRRTNMKSWQEFSPTDTSMNWVSSLADQQFDFGKTPTAKPAVASAAVTDSAATTTGYVQVDYTGSGA